MKKICPALLFLCVTLLCTHANAELYKHTDKDGVTTYSDIEVDGSTEVIIPKGNSVKLPKYIQKQKLTPDKKSDGYTQFSIISPENNATLRDSGNILVKMSVQPELNVDDGHRITVYIDNQAVTSNSESLSTNINNVDRGSHDIHAVIHDSDSKTVIQSNHITIHFKQSSRLH